MPVEVVRRVKWLLTLVFALPLTLFLVFLPFKLARGPGYIGISTIEEPVYMSCTKAPVHPSIADWPARAASGNKDLLGDQILVRQYVHHCLQDGTYTNSKNGKTETVGIAIVSGGAALLSSTLTVVTILRESLHSVLPVEVIYKGKEEYDEKLIAQLQVRSGEILLLSMRIYISLNKPYPTCCRQWRMSLVSMLSTLHTHGITPQRS